MKLKFKRSKHKL